jgi:hypothetical protein
VLPFGNNKDFIGRQSQLNRLIKMQYAVNAEEDCQRAALVGFGGVVKTQIAWNAPFSFRRFFQCFPLFGSRLVTVRVAFRDIGQHLDIPGFENDNADVKKLVRTRLSQVLNTVSERSVLK